MKKIILAVVAAATLMGAATASMANTLTVYNDGWFNVELTRYDPEINGADVTWMQLGNRRIFTNDDFPGDFVSINAKTGNIGKNNGLHYMGTFKVPAENEEPVYIRITGTLFNPGMQITNRVYGG